MFKRKTREREREIIVHFYTGEMTRYKRYFWVGFRTLTGKALLSRQESGYI